MFGQVQTNHSPLNETRRSQRAPAIHSNGQVGEAFFL